MAKTNIPKAQVQVTRRIFSTLSLIFAVLLFAVAGVALWAHTFIGDMVQHELSVQKIYFPEKGSKGFDAETYPTLQQYAGQLVDTPAKAKAYANEYIGEHLKATADGKTYSEISTLQRKDPTNAQLQQQKTTLFQGEMIRGILLTSGYGFGTIGIAAGIVAYIAIGISLALLTLGLILFRPLK